MKQFFINGSALFLSLVISTAIFLAIPVSNYVRLNVIQPPESKEIALTPKAVKAPPKKQKTPPKKQKTPPKSDAKKAPKSMARSRFAMDLGPGGGSGGAVIAGGGAGGPMSFEEGETDDPPVPLRTPAPEYPAEALKQGVQGLVRMRIVITPEGNVDVQSVQFLETPGDYGFEEAILAILPQWKFKPAKVEGVPVAAKMEFPLEF